MTWGKRGPGKYSNVRTDGYASKREARRAAELRMLEQAGAISDLKEQVRFEIIPALGDEKAAHYVADFTFVDEGKLVVEDVKGVKTDVYVLKRKLMLKVHGIKIVEI